MMSAQVPLRAPGTLGQVWSLAVSSNTASYGRRSKCFYIILGSQRRLHLSGHSDRRSALLRALFLKNGANSTQRIWNWSGELMGGPRPLPSAVCLRCVEVPLQCHLALSCIGPPLTEVADGPRGNIRLARVYPSSALCRLIAGQTIDTGKEPLRRTRNRATAVGRCAPELATMPAERHSISLRAGVTRC
jgi:hypothetical protein